MKYILPIIIKSIKVESHNPRETGTYMSEASKQGAELTLSTEAGPLLAQRVPFWSKLQKIGFISSSRLIQSCPRAHGRPTSGQQLLVRTWQRNDYFGESAG